MAKAFVFTFYFCFLHVNVLAMFEETQLKYYLSKITSKTAEQLKTELADAFLVHDKKTVDPKKLLAVVNEVYEENAKFERQWATDNYNDESTSSFKLEEAKSKLKDHAHLLDELPFKNVGKSLEVVLNAIVNGEDLCKKANFKFHEKCNQIVQAKVKFLDAITTTHQIHVNVV